MCALGISCNCRFSAAIENVWLQLQPFPTVTFRNVVLLALTIDVCGSFLWDRLLLGIFAYPVLRASLMSTTRKDVISMLKTFAVVIALVSWIASQDYSELIEEMEKMDAAGDSAIPSNFVSQ